MSHAAFRVLGVLVLGMVGGGCIGELPVDDVPWACTSDAQCGWRARCIDRVCVLVDSQQDTAVDTDSADTETVVPDTAQPTGFLCDATVEATEPDETTTFEVFWSIEDSRWKITVALGDLQATYDLPPDVVVPDPASPQVGPLLECCENPCCPPLP